MAKIYAAVNIVDVAPGRVIVNKSCYVTSVVVNPSAGTQTLTIKDSGTPVKILIGPVTFAPANIGIPTVMQLYNDRVLMTDGVVAVTTGSGTVDIWVCATKTDEE